ncbi:MAG: glycoside hydrolase family 127 protein, partial [Bacteroidales bacterium]|nr:glycoside hydrolase family 127 protein [Bacteroidales bacterium]
MRTINPVKSWAKQRWVNARYNGSHELYNAGHMYEAAVAYYEATGKHTLLDVAIRNADLLCSTFGPGKREIASGHQEIEIGLAKLYRITGEKNYLDLAKFLLDERGKDEKSGSTYTQDHLPVIEQESAVGHAVRATYMYSAMADIAALTGDSAYIRAIDKIWNDVVSGKIYLTGGIGSRSSGEAYGDPYELPNLTAYNETCAAVANVFWNYRMFLLHGESKYIDVLERTLYNGLISGVSLNGTSFFYPNPLESEGNYSRAEWFDCSCCPSNISRFIPSVSGYIYATRADTVFVNLYIGSEGTLHIGGHEISITQSTQYPWDGEVTITVNPREKVLATIALRIPCWAQNEVLPGGLYHFAEPFEGYPSVDVNGKLRPLRMHHGYAIVTNLWHPGDQIRLSIPMPVRKVTTIGQVADDRDKVAFTRGPIVYCAEGIDNDGNVKELVVNLKEPFTFSFDPDLLNGVGILKGDVRRMVGDGFSSLILFRPSSLFLIPYYAWCHRGAGAMNVWFYNDLYVFPPLMEPPTALFLDTLTVRFKRYQGQDLFYSEGEDLPLPGVNPYDGFPVTLNNTVIVHALAFNRDGKPSEMIDGNYLKVQLAPALSVGEPAPGLLCRYYEGRFRKLPLFDTLVPLKTVAVNDIDAYTARDTADAYAFEFEGYIAIPQDGVYTFFIRSDDGGRILIDDEQVTISDGLHEITEASGQAALAEGFHNFRVQFFDYGGEEGLEVWIAGPDIKKQRIPEIMYYHQGEE